MDSYLDLAASVLKEVRRPLGAREILETAYQLSIVPRNLFGKTQHKTLQARISEDIKNERSRSIFVRTDPGRFFLRAYLTDPSISSMYKREYPAKPRADQLQSFNVLCFPRDTQLNLHGTLLNKNYLDQVPMFSRRLSEVIKDDTYIFLRTFVITERLEELVVRRSYNSRDQLGGSIALGSMGFVTDDDKTIFSDDAHGYAEASIRTLSEQLALGQEDVNLIRELHAIRLLCLVPAPEQANDNSIAAVFVCRCPRELDPISRYTGSGSLYWHPIQAGFNNIEALDLWSRELMNLGVFNMAIST